MKSKAVISFILIAVIFSSAVSQTRDTWRSVRTNHLFVIGNADAEKLRQVAAWLEFFHSAFARLVSRNVIDSSVPTTVVIFRDDASFTPFKPRYQGRPANIAGFFQPGNDVNYIALSLDPTESNPYSTAFHEYVHLHIKDNVPGAPLWLNEGLAELYGSLQFSGNDAMLGAPLPYIHLLRQQELLPLKILFSIDTRSPHYNEQEKSGIFYGESWALVHYLMLGERDRQEQFRRFLQLVSRGDDAAKAIENAFGVSLPELEDDFKTYVRRGNITAQRIASVDAQNYASYTAMQRSSLTEGEANYYLGDLLAHQRRFPEAKPYLLQSTRLAPDFAPPHYLLALLNFITNQDLNEAIPLAEKAHKLAPSNNEYSNLLAHLKLKRGDPAAAREAQESLKNAMGSGSVQTGSSSMLGGGSGSVAINDGRTIDSSGALPTVDEVLKKYIDALGGVEALKAVTSRVTNGVVDFVGVSRGGTFESHAQAPNKLLDTIQIAPVGTIKIGYNGREGWTRSVEGQRKLNKVESAGVQLDADFYAPLRLKSVYSKVTLAGKSKIGYREVYVLELQPAVGPVTKIYLDAESYLPARIDKVQTWGTTSLATEIYLDDWREVDGIKYPFSFSQSSKNMTLKFTVKEIRHNVPVDARIFELRF